MITIQFNDIDQLRSGLKKARGNLKFGTSLGINRSAQKAKLYEQKEMRSKFSSPKPFTINSVFIKPSNKRQPVIHAVVGLKDQITKGTPAAEYLEAQIEGGSRNLKPFETMMKLKGGLRKFRPAKGEKLNRYGNMAKARVKKIAKNVNKKGSKFFSRVEAGYSIIYQKHGRGARKIKPVMIETGGNNYRKLFDFYKTGRKALDQNFSAEMHKAMIQAFNG